MSDSCGFDAGDRRVRAHRKRAADSGCGGVRRTHPRRAHGRDGRGAGSLRVSTPRLGPANTHRGHHAGSREPTHSRAPTAQPGATAGNPARHQLVLDHWRSMATANRRSRARRARCLRAPRSACADDSRPAPSRATGRDRCRPRPHRRRRHLPPRETARGARLRGRPRQRATTTAT